MAAWGEGEPPWGPIAAWGLLHGAHTAVPPTSRDQLGAAASPRSVRTGPSFSARSSGLTRGTASLEEQSPWTRSPMTADDPGPPRAPGAQPSTRVPVCFSEEAGSKAAQRMILTLLHRPTRGSSCWPGGGGAREPTHSSKTVGPMTHVVCPLPFLFLCFRGFSYTFVSGDFPRAGLRPAPSMSRQQKGEHTGPRTTPPTRVLVPMQVLNQGRS